MRILRVRVAEWRNLRGVCLEVAPEVPLVCLVGENGTGKSAILELLSVASHQFGISAGVEIARGNPLDEPHEVEVTAQVPPSDLDLPQHLAEEIKTAGMQWAGLLRLTSKRDESGVSTRAVVADGVPEGIATQVGSAAVDLLRQRNETQHLYLDADRAYPPIPVEPNRYGEIWAQEWDSPQFTKQWAFRPTKTLYEEWMKYFLGVEERSATELVKGVRRARDKGVPEPSFKDPFDHYRDALLQVLPHLHFVGVESTGPRRTPMFDSAGSQLAFWQLSGGEREIAFLVGQVDRFRLERGLLLIDEPELHLNPDLLRTWLAFLRDTVKDGQVWIATHSLEAVEVAGPEATFVFERDAGSRTVTNPSRLAGRPVLSVLSAAVGSPAFSISRLRFVYVEGDRPTRERERFFSVCGEPEVNRFLEGGSCQEVTRRLRDLRALAEETAEQLHVGGVIDRDFRTDDACSELEADAGVHVLGCHEIENLFLQPEAVGVLLERGGLAANDAAGIIRDAADNFAGLWVGQYSASRAPDAFSVPKAALSAVSDTSRDDLVAGWDAYRAASVAQFDVVAAGTWDQLLAEAWNAYEQARLSEDWYRKCLGKQTLSRVASAIGLSSAQVLEQQIVRLWSTDAIKRPADLVSLRAYIESIGGA